ncbi:hypothetical protein HYR54_07700 [Candidatus Acetothermia bacterium]|nr:hypothetical protein [Candidatus Acetothermia bacterium]
MSTTTFDHPRTYVRRTTRGHSTVRQNSGLQRWAVYSTSQTDFGVTFYPWLVIDSVPVDRVLTRGLLRQAGFKFEEWAAPWYIARLTEKTPRALLQRIELQDVTRLSWQILLDHAGLSARKALIYS